MNRVVISVKPIGTDKRTGKWGLAQLECAPQVNSATKLAAVANALDSVVLGDSRCEYAPDLKGGLLFHRGRPSGLAPLRPWVLNRALRVLSVPIVWVDGGEWDEHEVVVRFRFALRPWHLERLSGIAGVKKVGYAEPGVRGKRLAVFTLSPYEHLSDGVFRHAVVQAVTADVTF